MSAELIYNDEIIKCCEEVRKPGRIMQEMIARAKHLLKITEEEIEKLQRELMEMEQDKKELEIFLQSFGEEEG